MPVILGHTYKGGSATTTNGATLSVSPNANIAAGQIVVVRCASDDAANAANPFHTLADSKGNTWTKIREQRNLQTAGTANDGVIGSLWVALITNPILTTDTITLTCAASVGGKAIGVQEFTPYGTVTGLTVTSNNGANGTNTAAPTTGITGIAAVARLWVGAVAIEGPVGDVFTQDADYTGDTGIGAGSNAAGITSRFGYRESSLDTDSYNPTLGTARDLAIIIGCILITATPPTGNLNPQHILGSKFWAGYRADQSGEITHSSGAVSAWNDWSGNARHLGQSTAGSQFAYSATSFPGSLPGLTTNGDLMFDSSIAHTAGQKISVMMVLDDISITANSFNPRHVALLGSSAQDWDAEGYALCIYDGSEWCTYHNGTFAPDTGAVPPSGAYILCMIIEPDGNSKIRLNGTQISVGVNTAYPSTAFQHLVIGHEALTGSGGPNSIYAEFVFASGDVSDTEWEQLEGYAAHKWGLAAVLPSGHPYKSSPPSGGSSPGKPAKWWNGSAWVTKPLKRWDGSAWIEELPKVWNGTDWI